MSDWLVEQLEWHGTCVRNSDGLCLLQQSLYEIERLRDQGAKDAAEIGRLLAEYALLRRQLAAVVAERDLWQRESHT